MKLLVKTGPCPCSCTCPFMYFVACPFMSMSCSCPCPCPCLVSCVHVCVRVRVLPCSCFINMSVSRIPCTHVGVPCRCPMSMWRCPRLCPRPVFLSVSFFLSFVISRVRSRICAQCPCHVSPSMFMSCVLVRVVSFFLDFIVSRVRVACPPCLCLVSRVRTCLYPCFINMFMSVFVSVYVCSIRVRVHAWWTWLCSHVNSLTFEDHSILRPGPTPDPIGPQLIIIPDSVLLQSINNKQSFLLC